MTNEVELLQAILDQGRMSCWVQGLLFGGLWALAMFHGWNSRLT